MSRSRERALMVELQLSARGISDDRVLRALGEIERELFVPAGHEDDAYADVAVPLGYGQALWRPVVAARAIQLLRLTGDEHVLVVGCGSGYVAAAIARLARDVVAVDRVPQLAARATRALSLAGVANVRVLSADGLRGVPAHAPYDAILSTIASPSAPIRLHHELAAGGRLVTAVGPGSGGGVDRLDRIELMPEGPVVTESSPP